MSHDYFPAEIDGKFCKDNPRRFTLDADFIYDDPEKDIRVVIPAGFTTDFNSTPWIVWWYFSPYDVLEAGLVHDWLYKSPAAFTSTTLKPPLDRGQCDDIHRRILDLKGMRWSKRNIIYGFLRSGGVVAWNRHRAADVTS
jgi:hypothetical protein